MRKLSEILQELNKKTVIYETSDGSRLLLLPYGARVLGLYSAQNEKNFYWTNPALKSVDSGKTVFSPDSWQNTGGDRTWITPELDIFFPDYPCIERHWEPPQLDASEYFVQETPRGVLLGKRMTLDFARARRKVTFDLTKEITGALNPLRNERSLKLLLNDLEFAGYTQIVRLELANDSEMWVQSGIWNLIQLPNGGEIIVPTYSQTKPLILFGQIPENKLELQTHCVKFKTGFPGECKIAIRAIYATGRIGYVYADEQQLCLIVRNFFVNPSGDYVDVPKFDPNDFGYAVHAVTVNSALGNFCEIEHHAPAIIRTRKHCEDISQVWAFRGSKNAISKVSHLLLGIEIV